MNAPRTGDRGESRSVRVEYGKWGDRPHYQLELAWLGEDEFGVWLWAPAGNLVSKGDHSFLSPGGTLGLVPRQGMWSALWWFDTGDIELYIDVNTSPVWDEDDRRVSMIDLDLDVARFRDGRVEILDRDEFDEHRVEYGYPPDVVEAALLAADEIHGWVAGNTEPFDATTHLRWLAVREPPASTSTTPAPPPAAP